MTQKFSREELIKGQLSHLNGRIQTWEEKLNSLSQTRFNLFIIAFILSGGIFFWQGAIVWGMSFIPLFIPFIVYVVIYNRLFEAKERWLRWKQIKASQLARMGLHWQALPESHWPTNIQEHPYGSDLDLVGPRSLHHLINTAVTQEGSDRLQSWLLGPLTSIEKIEDRQQLVRELEIRPLFRDKLILHSQASLNNVEKFPGHHLLRWLNSQNEDNKLVPWMIGLTLLAGATAVLLIYNNQLPFTHLWLVSLAIYGLLYIRVSNQYTQTIFQDATFLTSQLDTLNNVFQFIESNHFQNAPHLKSLCQPFHEPTNKPSENIRQIQRVMIGIGLRQNPLLGFVLNIILPWDMYFAYLLLQRQAVLKKQLPIWLDIWNELEALGSLANLAYLNPNVVNYPVFSTSSLYFETKAMAHPLIPQQSRVGNDFTIQEIGQVGIITGSNMAGKSSFLRTLGLNLVLAYCGGPIFASTFKTALFRLHSSIQVSDSLQDGFSFFYAEVQRLKSILEAYEMEDKRPLFFLIDEIFRGTNNRERLIGSQAFIEVLASGKAVGLVATHDLELVKLAERFETIQNFHFRDDVVDGKMVFDYTLREGPCPTTNALKIMALAGLPVKNEDVSPKDTE